MKVQMTELNRSQLLMDQFGRRLASRLDSSWILQIDMLIMPLKS